MADGFIRWYRKSGATSVFAEQVSLFEAHGMSLAHPARKQAVVLDIEGEQVFMPQEELGRLLGLRIAPLTMEWWLTADTNVIDEYTYQPFGCEIQTLWLDGLYTEEMQLVEAAVIAATTQLPMPTHAVVIDRLGTSDPDDWDSLMLYDGANVPRFPDVVIAQEPIAEKIMGATPGLTKGSVGGCLTRLAPARQA
ncbi:hypothetical protein DWB77_07452 [Streptomyces hundungensis]|uniref:Uncharacterized protein n=1 Tax=Streptomyces hundungensis TaxID=1077946 RepID=A0A387HMY0_9ACTN|nr:hypothetical protein [Streptomyces hundungensis]AYG85235.1 hypothetical protein DWB77_07452 [Streptomyces hundungensis]